MWAHGPDLTSVYGSPADRFTFFQQPVRSRAEEIRGYRRPADQVAQRRVVFAVFLGQRFHRDEEFMRMRQLMPGKASVMAAF